MTSWPEANVHVNGCYRMNVNVEYSREVPLKIAKQDTRSRKYDLCDVPQDDVILVMFLRLRITNLYIFSYSLKVDSVFYYCSNNRTLSQSRALDNFICVCVRSCVCVSSMCSGQWLISISSGAWFVSATLTTPMNQELIVCLHARSLSGPPNHGASGRTHANRAPSGAGHCTQHYRAKS